MNDTSREHSIQLFFKSFSDHLKVIRDDGKDSAQAFRAQILLGQLRQFEKAMFEALNMPSAEGIADNLTSLFLVKDLKSFFSWLEKAGHPLAPDTLFFQNSGALWERCFGNKELPHNLKVNKWVEKGLLASLHGEGNQFITYAFGQPRVIMQFSNDGVDSSEKMELACFVARFINIFISVPIPVSTRSARPVHGVIAHDARFVEVLALIERAASRNVSILLEGESGVGKEVVADYIHKSSNRSRKPFVAVNCAAIPSGLIESELFGHEKGSFTGAYSRQVGRVEEADGGTLFLDEIGEMDHSVQAKMLRFLQLHEFHRVGGKQKVTVDVRIVAATNRNLKKLVAEGKFRDDLYYRLSVMPFLIPPLRERVDDIVPLTHFFMEKYAQKFGMSTPAIEPAVLQVLGRYPFPGNVRELENIIQNMLVLCQGQTIRMKHLPDSLNRPSASKSFGIPEKRQPRKWKARILGNCFVPRSFTSERKADSGTQNFFSKMQTPENNAQLKQAKKAIQSQANQLVLELEYQFVQRLLSKAEGSMPVASELGGINRTLLYKMLDRTKHLSAEG